MRLGILPKLPPIIIIDAVKKKESAGPDSSIGILRSFSQTLNPDGVKIIS